MCARKFLGDVFEAFAVSRCGERVAPLSEMMVAVCLLSGARKSEKLAFAFDARPGVKT